MAAKRKNSTPARASKSSPSPAKGKPAAGKKSGSSGSDDRLAHLERLITLMEQKSVVEVELEEAGTRWRVRRTDPNPPMQAYAPSVMPAMLPAAMPAHAAASAAGAAPAAAPAAKEPEGEVFKSPMLGTFYRAASPDAEPFVKVGDKVSADRTLCIIEAMKVMNEIKAEREFEVLDILVKNGEPVEFGQPLFLIR
ncbi:MAG: hypothetical protein RL398_600 [Planctomycetota bacterium]|jgi:acetyl-CoA carboxylase biotin carboxyl carrier protein